MGVLVAGLWSMAPSDASAQASAAANARQLIATLITNKFVDPTTNRERVQALVDELTKSIVIGISTAPIGASSAGFTYEFDSQTGERTLKSASFGPLFVERPLTNGRGVFSFGTGFQYAKYERFQGVEIRDPGLLLFDNRVRYQVDNFEQFIKEYLVLEPRVNTVSTVFSYGVTRSLDIGVIVPFTSIELAANRYLDYDVSKTFQVDPADRRFFTPGPRGSNFVLDGGTISASGIGDMTIRAKYAFGAQAGEGAAVVFDVRLPTGDEDNLLGAGKSSGRVGLVGSKQVGTSVSVYGNGGYRFGGLDDEATYAAALDAALFPSKKLTVSFEILGQYLKNSVSEISEVAIGPRPATDSRFTPPLSAIYSAVEPVLLLGGVNLVHGAVGLKYNVGGSALLTGGVLFPIGDSGFSTRTTLFVGFDVSVAGR
jgi:hypothetical protein